MSVEVGKRIKTLLEDQNKKQKDLIEYLDENQATVSKWLSENEKLNRDMPYEVLKKTALYFGVSTDYLLGNSMIIERFVPLIGKASCGIPGEYSLDGYEAVPVDSRIYQEGMYAVEAEGDSMKGKVDDGNIVYCLPVSDIIELNNKIVHYSINNDSGIKKLKINEDGSRISLIPLNSDYDIITIDADENTILKVSKIVGVVDTNF